MTHPIFKILEQASKLGHTAIDREIGAKIKRQNGFNYDPKSLDPLYQTGEIRIVNGYDPRSRQVLRRLLSTMSSAKNEARISSWFHRSLASPSWVGDSLGKRSGPPEAALFDGLTPSQAEAHAGLMHAPMGILCGAPGTGKTYTIARLIKYWKGLGYSVKVCAPTGKAAQVLSNKVSCEVKTIHSMLGMTPGSMPEFGRDYPMLADIFVVDESSMIDSEMMGWLLESMSEQSGLVLVGDAYQLPPVGAGSPFLDIIRSGIIKVFELKEVKRQAEDSGIISLAHALIRNKKPMMGNGVEFVRSPKLSELEAFATNWWVENRGGDTKIIAPLRSRKFEASVLRINDSISEARFGSCDTLNTGDVVIFTRNDRKLNVVNGMEGVIAYSSPDSYHVISGDRRIVVPKGSIDGVLERSYAITVHKSQGSEWDEVLLLLPTNADFMFQLRLVYTAVTRAKRKLTIVGNPYMLSRGKGWEVKRITMLPYLLNAQGLTNTIVDSSFMKTVWESIK